MAFCNLVFRSSCLVSAPVTASRSYTNAVSPPVFLSLWIIFAFWGFSLISSNFLSLFPLFFAVVFTVLQTFQTFLKCLMNAGCCLHFNTKAVWELSGRTLENEGAGMSLGWGPLSAGDREDARCQLGRCPTGRPRGHAPHCPLACPPAPAPGSGQWSHRCGCSRLGVPQERGQARPCPGKQVRVARKACHIPSQGQGGGSHSQTPWAKIREGGLPGDTPEQGKGAERPQQ